MASGWIVLFTMCGKNLLLCGTAESDRIQGEGRVGTKVKFIVRGAVVIIVALVALYLTQSALISVILAAVAFGLTKTVLSLWTTPADELYEAMRSGQPERIKAAMTLCTAAENADKQGMKAATDALAQAIREGGASHRPPLKWRLSAKLTKMRQEVASQSRLTVLRKLLLRR